ncbi:hypothetical protein D3C86_2068500 [compost metagenome]
MADNSLISGGGFIQWTYGAEDNMTFQLVETDVTYEAESAVLHSLSTESTLRAIRAKAISRAGTQAGNG